MRGESSIDDVLRIFAAQATTFVQLQEVETKKRYRDGPQ